MNWIESIAVAFGFLCVWLTVRQNIWCWPAGLVQVTLYIYIFYSVRLYSDLILHVIYVFLSIYGWYHWLHGGRDREVLPVSSMQSSVVAGWLAVGLAGSSAVGFLMHAYTNAALPYADAVIMNMSLIAQWLMARKKLESWLFWIMIDVVAVGVYFSKELYLTTILYAAFLMLAITGFIAWKKDLAPARSETVPVQVN